jgi:polysaccharide biosynthesis protein PslG
MPLHVHNLRARARALGVGVLLVALVAATLVPPLATNAESPISDESAAGSAPADATPMPAPAAGGERLFAQTGFRIDRDTFWDYFLRRGGVATFGYPVSRDFLFFGCRVQFFQREVLQQCNNQGVGTLNLLDDQFLPYSAINGSVFPAADNAVKSATPLVSNPGYSTAILDFVSSNAPDTFDGQPVNFGKTFFNTISPDLAGTDDRATRGLLALEIWGAPTSKPAYDPTNRNFIYQRFQRGVMHYDKGCGCTQGLLLADWLKAIITGQQLPADLTIEAKSSPLYQSAINGSPPTATDYTDAFTPVSGSAPAAARANPSPTVVPNPPELVASPDYGLSMFLWLQPTTTARDLKIAADGGFHWQKTLFQWRQIEAAGKGKFDWSEADRVVAASTKAGVKVIGRLDFSPGWARTARTRNGPPDNYQDYWDFVSAFVSRYKPGSPNGSVDAIEVWNEVNLTREWNDAPIGPGQAADYVRLLSGAYKVAHAANPGIIVISAGLSPTGVKNRDAWDDVEYMQWLFNAGMKGGVNYDALAANANAQAPEPDAALDSLPTFGHPSFYFRRVEQLREVMVKAGDANRQVWLMEFGWTADPVHPDYAWYAVSEDKKAANIVKAFQYARQNWTPWIGVMTVWTLADPNWTPQQEEYWWAITNPDGTPRAALTAIEAARAAGQL